MLSKRDMTRDMNVSGVKVETAIAFVLVREAEKSTWDRAEKSHDKPTWLYIVRGSHRSGTFGEKSICQKQHLYWEDEEQVARCCFEVKHYILLAWQRPNWDQVEQFCNSLEEK